MESVGTLVNVNEVCGPHDLDGDGYGSEKTEANVDCGRFASLCRG